MSDVDFLQEQIARLELKLRQVEERQVAQVAQHDRPSRVELELSEDVAACVTPHLQFKPLRAEDRKRILAGHPRVAGLPKPTKDNNGLAAKAVHGAQDKKWLTSTIPQLQQDALDVLRVAVAGWEQSQTFLEPEAQAQVLLSALRDVVVLTQDNAQRLAETQLKGVFSAADAPGAYSFLNLDGEDQDHDIDTCDNNIISSAHAEALAEFRKYAGQVKRKNESSGSNNNKGKYRNYSRGGRGGKGGGRGGKGRGKGRGSGSSNNDGGSGNDS